MRLLWKVLLTAAILGACHDSITQPKCPGWTYEKGCPVAK